MRARSARSRMLLFVSLVFMALTASASACNPSAGTGVKVAEGVGIRDYFTMRSVAGELTTRDVKPEPRPREAITGDDYFQVKLEHIFIGDALGREVGNLAIISQIDGIIPKKATCNEMKLQQEIGVDFDQRERNNLANLNKCAYKHVVSVNPVFNNGHVTFDSAFITPPFRMGKENVELRFIMAQLNDVELARQLLAWGQEQLSDLSSWGLEELDLNKWQSKLVDIGFTMANYLLDYAAKPDYVFEFETDFVPIESVGGVTTPQNLFMGGDFVIAGFPKNPDPDESVGALAMADQLQFDSGRLYWKGSRDEYRDGAYIVFKVVRQSRYPGALPVQLESINRSLERGKSADEVSTLARNILLDLQDARVLNETEGAYLKDLVAWFAEARTTEKSLDGASKGDREEPEHWPMALREVGMAVGPDLATIKHFTRARVLMEELDQLFENFSRSPGMTQAECVVIRDVTQGIEDNYERLRPTLTRAFEDLQLRRAQMQKSGGDPGRLQAMMDAEVWTQRELDALPNQIEAPKCPALRD